MPIRVPLALSSPRTPTADALQQERQTQQVNDQYAEDQDFIAQQQKEQAKAQQAQEAAAADAARAQKAVIANAKRAGAVVAPDATGTEQIQRHEDGQPVYQAGFIGTPQVSDKGGAAKYRDARGSSYEVPFDAIRTEQDPAGETFYSFDVTGPDGTKQTMRQPAGTKPLFRVDPSTGNRLADMTDPATGSVRTQVVGIDRPTASKAAIAKRRDALQLRQNEISGQAEELRLQRELKDTLFSPVKERFNLAQDAQEKINKAKIRYEQRPDPEGKLALHKVHYKSDGEEEYAMPVSNDPQAIASAQAWIDQKKRADADFAAAKAEHDPAKTELQTMDEQRARLAINILEEKRRAEEEIRKMDEAAKAGQPVYESEWQKQRLSLAANPRVQDIETVAALEDAGDPMAEDVQRATVGATAKRFTELWNAGFTGPQDMTGKGPLQPGQIPSEATREQVGETQASVRLVDGLASGLTAGKPATVADSKAARDIAAKSLGMQPEGVEVSEQKPEGYYELTRNGEMFATLDPRNNRLTLLDTPASLQDKGAEIIANASPDGVPVYMVSSEQPFRPAEVRDLIQTGINAARNTKTEIEAEQALADVGLDSAGIRQKVMAGKLSVQDGKMLNEKLNNVQQVNATATAVKAEFGKFLTETPILAEKYRNGTREQKAEVVNLYMDGFAAKAGNGVVIDRSLLAQRRAELLAATDERGAISKAAGFTGGAIKSGIASLAGIGYWMLRAPDRAMRLVGGTDDEGTNLVYNQSRDLVQRLAGENAPWNKDSGPMGATLGEVEAWANRADSVDDMPDELADKLAEQAFTNYHGFSAESAADVETSRDTFNVKKNPQLRPMLENYLKTGNGASFQGIYSMLKQNARERQTAAEVQKYIERPRAATPAAIASRASLLGIQLDPAKATAALNLSKQLEEAKDEKQAAAVLKQAATVLGLENPDHAALALSEISREETTDPESWTGMFRGASVAGIEEVATEVVSDVALAALSATVVGAPEAIALKGAQIAAKQGIRGALNKGFQRLVTHNLDNLANRSAKFAQIREVIGKGRTALGNDLRQMGDDFQALGIRQPKFGQALTTGQKAANLAVGTIKATVAGAPIEALEEGLTAVLSNDPSAAAIGDAMLQGAIGVGGITPVFAGVQGIRNAFTARGQSAKWEKVKGDYIAKVNEAMAKNPGFKPLTIADFDAWQGLQESPEHKAATAEWLTAKQAFDAQVNAFAQASQSGPAVPPPSLIAAKVALEAAHQNLAGLSQVAFEAMDEIRTLAESERVLYTAAAKAAAGATDYTEAEAKALMQQSGANAVIFQQAQTLPANVQGPAQLKNLADIPNVTTAAPGVYRLPDGVRLNLPQPLVDMLAQKSPSMVNLMGRGTAPATAQGATSEAATKSTKTTKTPTADATTPAVTPSPTIPPELQAKLKAFDTSTFTMAEIDLVDEVMGDESPFAETFAPQEEEAPYVGLAEELADRLKNWPNFRFTKGKEKEEEELINSLWGVSSPFNVPKSFQKAKIKKDSKDVAEFGQPKYAQALPMGERIDDEVEIQEDEVLFVVENVVAREMDRRNRLAQTRMIRLADYQEHDGGMKADPINEDILINVTRLARSAWNEANLKGGTITRRDIADHVALTIDHEVVHIAQIKAAHNIFDALTAQERQQQAGTETEPTFWEWVKGHYGRVWREEFTAEEQRAVITAYGSILATKDEWIKAFEAFRMLVQTGSKGRLSEAVLRHLQGVLVILKRWYADLKGDLELRPVIKAEIEGIEAVLADAENPARAFSEEWAAQASDQELSDAQAELAANAAEWAKDEGMSQQTKVGIFNAQGILGREAKKRATPTKQKNERPRDSQGTSDLRPKGTNAGAEEKPSGTGGQISENVGKVGGVAGSSSVTPDREVQPYGAAEVAPKTPKSSTQFTLSPADAKPILDFGASIPKDELFTSIDPEWSDGALETEPHVTVLYGLTKHEAAPVAKAIKDHGPVTVTLGKLSIFENGEYDVLKIDVEGPELRSLNAKLSKLPNENSFPDYRPHMTIAYLKKGEGKKYVGDTRFEGQTITFDTMTFSPPSELRGKLGKPELPLTPSQAIQPEVRENPTPEEKAELEELDSLMERRGQAQNKVKGATFSKKDEARFQELGAKLRRFLFETVDAANDAVVGEDINGQPIRQSKNGTLYTVENGRVRTAPAFKPDPEYSRQQDELLAKQKAAPAVEETAQPSKTKDGKPFNPQSVKPKPAPQTVSAVTAETETPGSTANAVGGSQGVQTEPAEGSIPTVTEDTYYHGSNEDFETFGTVRHAQTAQGRKSSVTPITKESRGQIYLTQDQDYAGTYGSKVKPFKIGDARLASFENLGHRDVSADQMNAVLAGMEVDHTVKGDSRPVFEWLKYGDLKKPLVRAGFDGFRLQESRSDNGRVAKTVAIFDNAKVSAVTAETETPGSATGAGMKEENQQTPRDRAEAIVRNLTPKERAGKLNPREREAIDEARMSLASAPAAQNAEPSPGGLSEAEVRQLRRDYNAPSNITDAEWNSLKQILGVSDEELANRFEEMQTFATRGSGPVGNWMWGKFYRVTNYTYSASSSYVTYKNILGEEHQFRISDHRKPPGHPTARFFRLQYIGHKGGSFRQDARNYIASEVKADPELAIETLEDVARRQKELQSEENQYRQRREAEEKAKIPERLERAYDRMFQGQNLKTEVLGYLDKHGYLNDLGLSMESGEVEVQATLEAALGRTASELIPERRDLSRELFNDAYAGSNAVRNSAVVDRYTDSEQERAAIIKGVQSGALNQVHQWGGGRLVSFFNWLTQQPEFEAEAQKLHEGHIGANRDWNERRAAWVDRVKVESLSDVRSVSEAGFNSAGSGPTGSQSVKTSSDRSQDMRATFGMQMDTAPSGPEVNPSSSRAAGGPLASSPARQSQMLEQAAATLRGEGPPLAPGLRSMFNPQARRPATGERGLFDRPKDQLADSIQKAYRAVQMGQSTVMVPIRAVFQRLKAANPALTVDEYLAAIQAADQRGDVMLEAANTTAEQQANAPFVVPSQSGPGVRMAWVDNRPPQVLASAPSNSPQTPTQQAIYEIRQQLESADAGRSEYPIPEKRLRAQAKSLLQWAASAKRIIDRAELERATTRHAGLGGGEEHDVWHDASGGRVVKLTKPGAYGIQQDLTRYLDTIEYSNRVFGDDIVIEGVVFKDGWTHILISQPFYRGEMAPQPEIDEYFATSHGAQSTGRQASYLMPDGARVYDAKPRNVLKLTDDTVQPIDVQVALASAPAAQNAEPSPGGLSEAEFARLPEKEQESILRSDDVAKARAVLHAGLALPTNDQYTHLTFEDEPSKSSKSDSLYYFVKAWLTDSETDRLFKKDEYGFLEYDYELEDAGYQIDDAGVYKGLEIRISDHPSTASARTDADIELIVDDGRSSRSSWYQKHPDAYRSFANAAADIPSRVVKELRIKQQTPTVASGGSVPVGTPALRQGADQNLREDESFFSPVNPESSRAAGGTLASAPAPDTEREQQVREVLAAMPPIWRNVLQDQWNNKSIEDIAAARNLSLVAVGNILRRSGGLFDVLMKKAAAATPEVAVEDDIVKAVYGRPDLARSGDALMAALDQNRPMPEVVHRAEMEDLAGAMFSGWPTESLAIVKRWMDSGGMMTVPDNLPHGLKVILDEASARGAAPMLMQVAANHALNQARLNNAPLSEQMRLGLAWRELGTEQARAFGARQDTFHDPMERHALYIQKMLTTPQDGDLKTLLNNPASRSRILAEMERRAEDMKRRLKAAGYDLDAWFAEQKAVATEAASFMPPAAAPQLKRLPRKVQHGINAWVAGAKLQDAAREAGMTAQELNDAYADFYAAVNQEALKAAVTAKDEMLRSAPAPNDFAAQIGLPPPPATADPNARLNDTPKARAYQARRENAALNRPTEVAAAMSEMSAGQSGFIGKMAEYWRMSILSGPQTWVVNASSGLALGMYRNMVQKLGTAGLASIVRATGMADLPNAPALSDIGPVLQHAWDSFVPSLKNAFRSWKHNRRLYDAYAKGNLTLDPGGKDWDFDKSGIVMDGKEVVFKGEKYGPALSRDKWWKLGAIMDVISFRMLLIADEFVRSWFGRIETAAQLRQMARSEPALKKRTEELRAEIKKMLPTAWELRYTNNNGYYAVKPAVVDFIVEEGQNRRVEKRTIMERVGAEEWSAAVPAAKRDSLATNAADLALHGGFDALLTDKATPEQLKARLDRLGKPGSGAWMKGVEAANTITAQSELGTGVRAVDAIDGLADLIQRGKTSKYALVSVPMQFLFPFVATPVNLFKTGITMSPVGGFLALIDAVRSYRRRKAGDLEGARKIMDAARALEEIVNQTVAWGLVLTLSELMEPDDDEEDPKKRLPRFTGTGEWKALDAGERQLAYKTAPPLSFRIGDRWFSYRRLDPFAIALANIADGIDAFKKEPTEKALFTVGVRAIDAMEEKTFLAGAADAMNLIRDPERYGPRWAANIATGFIPNLIRQPVRSADEQFRDKDIPANAGFLEKLERHIGYSIIPQFGPEKLDLWGRNVEKDTDTFGPLTDTAFRLLSPVGGSVPAPDALDVALYTFNLENAGKGDFGIEAPERRITRTIAGQKIVVDLTDEERANFIRQAGSRAHATVTAQYGGRKLTLEDVDNIREIVRKVYSVHRDAAFVAAVQKRGGVNSLLANTRK